MTLADRRTAVRAALIADPYRSDRLIAKLTGSSREMVASSRRGLGRDMSNFGTSPIDSSSGTSGTQPRPSQGPSRAFRRGMDGKTYKQLPPWGRGKSRIQLIRERLQRLLRDLQDETISVEFRAATRGTRDGIGRLSLELAAAVARLRRAGERRAEGRQVG